MDTHPSLTQIKSEIQHYDSIEQEVYDIKPIIVFGSTQLSTGKVTVMCSRQKAETVFLLHAFSLCWNKWYCM